jgi:hypothetical protein
MWMNGGIIHIHSGTYAGKYGHLASDAPSLKAWGGTMSAANIGRDIHVWDGNFHTWTFRIDDDLTYLGVDGIELFRIPTHPALTQKLHLIANFALKLSNGEPDRAVSHDMTIDYIEVRQERAKVEAFADPFLARPTLSRAPQGGQVITCTPNLPADLMGDVHFDWFYGDGYPIVNQFGPSYTPAAADAGKTIKCLVRAVAAVNQPEAWTDEMEAVA